MGNGQSVKKLEVLARKKSLHCSEWTIKGDSHEGSEEEKSCKESLSLLRQHLSGPEQNTGKNMDGKGHSDEVSDGNEGHVIGK